MKQPTENRLTSIFIIQVWHKLYMCHIHMYYKTDQHSSSSCKGTFGLLHIMGQTK